MPQLPVTTAVIAALSAALPMPAIAQEAPPPSAPYQSLDLPLITISAEGEMQTAPDMAIVTTGVQTTAPTAREAMAQNAVKMDKLVATLTKSGIERKHIQTSSINLNAQYDYSTARDGQPPRFIGYQAANQLLVQIHDLKRVGDLIDAMVAAGANNLNGPVFGLKDNSILLRQAREKALREAKARAEFYAAQSGYKSVRIVGISETGGGMPVPMPMPVMAMEEADAAPRTVVEPGQLSTSVMLSVQYVMER